MAGVIEAVMGRMLSEQAQIAVGTAAMRIVGARRLLGRDVAAAVLSLTGEPDDLDAVLSRTHDFRSWIAAWRDVSGVHS